MSRLDVLLAAGETAMDLVRTDQFDRAMRKSLEVIGQSLRDAIHEGERASILVPVQFDVDSKAVSLGAVLLLEHRFLFAWRVGSFRFRYFVDSVPYDTIEEVTTEAFYSYPADEAVVLRVRTANGTWKMVLNNNYAEGIMIFIPMVEGVLDGSIRVEWNDGH